MGTKKGAKRTKKAGLLAGDDSDKQWAGDGVERKDKQVEGDKMEGNTNDREEKVTEIEIDRRNAIGMYFLGVFTTMIMVIIMVVLQAWAAGLLD